MFQICRDPIIHDVELHFSSPFAFVLDIPVSIRTFSEFVCTVATDPITTASTLHDINFSVIYLCKSRYLFNFIS